MTAATEKQIAFINHLIAERGEQITRAADATPQAEWQVAIIENAKRAALLWARVQVPASMTVTDASMIIEFVKDPRAAFTLDEYANEEDDEIFDSGARLLLNALKPLRVTEEVVEQIEVVYAELETLTAEIEKAETTTDADEAGAGDIRPYSPAFQAQVAAAVTRWLPTLKAGFDVLNAQGRTDFRAEKWAHVERAAAGDVHPLSLSVQMDTIRQIVLWTLYQSVKYRDEARALRASGGGLDVLKLHVARG